MLQQASGGGGGARSYLLNDLLHHAKPLSENIIFTSGNFLPGKIR